MMRRLFLIGFLFFALSPRVDAQVRTSNACTDQMSLRLEQEQQFYRSVLLGQQEAVDLPQGAVRMDDLGNAWLKTGDDAWGRLGDTETLNDAEMDDRGFPPVRRGIFQTRATLTSDLLPSVVQSLRAFQCRLAAVCKAAEDSLEADDPDAVLTIQTDGCIEQEVPVLDACRAPDGDSTSLSQIEVGIGSCAAAASALFDWEATVLEGLVTYDSSYRSLAQVSGMFQGTPLSFSNILFSSLQGTLSVLKEVEAQPCFLASCHE